MRNTMQAKIAERLSAAVQWINAGGNDYTLLPNREWNQKQKHKKQPWGNVECFAFGGATVRFAALETSFHAANHTIPNAALLRGLSTLPQG